MTPPAKIKLTKHGAYKKTDDKRKWVKVAPRIQLFAIGQRLADSAFIAHIRFRDMSGVIRSVFDDLSILLPEKKRELRSKLATAGYEWPRDKTTSDAIWAAVVDTRPNRRFIFANAPGWYDAGFALPGRFFKPDTTTVRVIIDPQSVEHVGAFICGEGSLRSWKESVGKLARKSAPLRVSVAATLAAPLLRSLSIDSFAINWFGDTSEGKTFLLKAAASVSGLVGPDGLPGWADTGSAFEGQAMGHRDCMMPLDETADGENKMPLEKKARMLAFLIARNRPRKLSKEYERDHGLQNREFKILVQSSSERALRDVARDGGDPRLGGEEVRFMDVAVSEPGSQGIFDGKLRPEQDKTLSETAKAIVERTLALAILNQGYVLPAFLERLLQDNRWQVKVRDYKEHFEKNVKAPDLRSVYRMRSNFAVIWAAAALAIDYKLLPWKKGGTFRAIEKCFHRAMKALDGSTSTQAIEATATHSTSALKVLKEKLDQCELLPIELRSKASEEEAIARQKADGFMINGVPHLKHDRLEKWIPDKTNRSPLRRAGIFRTQRPDTPTVGRKISGIKGKPRYYVIDIEVLERLIAAR